MPMTKPQLEVRMSPLVDRRMRKAPRSSDLDSTTIPPDMTKQSGSIVIRVDEGGDTPHCNTRKNGHRLDNQSRPMMCKASSRTTIYAEYDNIATNSKYL